MKLLKLLPLLVLMAAPVAAEEIPVTAIANPQATSTGSVTNQAVQVINGSWPTNSYGGGVQCQGPSFAVTPFLFGTSSGQKPFRQWVDTDRDPLTPPEYMGARDNWSVNPGISMTFSTPLDGELQRLCKDAAITWTARQQAEADKARLDFELVRLIKCGEAAQMGVFFHPNSPYAGVCADVVVVQTVPPAEPSQSSAPSSDASLEPSADQTQESAESRTESDPSTEGVSPVESPAAQAALESSQAALLGPSLSVSHPLTLQR